MHDLKRVMAINDISGFGKCSLTVILPIISACGVEVSVVPTAVLSTHTGGLDGFTYRDLTDDIIPFTNHLKSLNLNFDVLYSGFLGSCKQIEIIKNVFKKFKTEENFILVDPCMADNGKLYRVYDNDMVKEMKKLCLKADILVPNITEACMLLGCEYKLYFSEKEIRDMLKELINFGCKKAVITGINYPEDKVGAACYDKLEDKFSFYFKSRVSGNFHGTGDIFASVLIAGLLNGMSLNNCVKVAVDFIVDVVKLTKENKTDERYGVNFESKIPSLIEKMNLCK